LDGGAAVGASGGASGFAAGDDADGVSGGSVFSDADAVDVAPVASPFISPFTYSWYVCFVSFRTIDRIAAFASIVVESTPTTDGSVNNFFSALSFKTHANTA